jgi:hypothetical protein
MSERLPFFMGELLLTKHNLGAFFAAQKTGLCGGSVPPHGLRPCAATAPRPSNPLRVSHPSGVSVFIYSFILFNEKRSVPAQSVDNYSLFSGSFQNLAVQNIRHTKTGIYQYIKRRLDLGKYSPLFGR